METGQGKVGMAEKNKQGSKQEAKEKSLFRQITKGDMVTISLSGKERRGHAVSREYGNWVLVLEHHSGSALATPQNTMAVSKPKKMESLPRVGEHIVYDDGRKTPGGLGRAEILEVTSRSMLVQFENHASPNLIYFDDPQFMDYITFEVAGDQPHSAADVEAENQRRE
jgi:hypothetical protein